MALHVQFFKLQRCSCNRDQRSRLRLIAQQPVDELFSLMKLPSIDSIFLCERDLWAFPRFSLERFKFEFRTISNRGVRIVLIWTYSSILTTQSH